MLNPALALRWQLATRAWLLPCWSLPILQGVAQLAVLNVLYPRDSVGRYLRNETKTRGYPLEQMCNKPSGLGPGSVFVMEPLSTVFLGSISHSHSALMWLMSYSQGTWPETRAKPFSIRVTVWTTPCIHLTRASGPNNYSDN